ncbi:hypothetical protein ACJ73_09277 [Blastomyces percursus]|uniref:Uncharacterized protein n=1 Tax=Blastomyces percursus TaxID=1658174 RepID=A0A1J9Q9Q3_9EURO|nr:hypothetical protein ACJ73_09277 [Blastomyces percursus]
MTPFAIAFALWTEQVGISRVQYQSLLQILRSLDDVALIHELPNGLSTLRKKCRAQFPILPVHATRLPIIAREQLPTLSANEKSLAEKTFRSLWYQDFRALIVALVKSRSFRQKMHIGMAEVVDKPTELWHSDSWGSSVKHTSGEFAKYPNGEPIWPSDFVDYTCERADCACRQVDTKHLGRVLFIGKDRRCESPYFDMTISRIQPILRYNSSLVTNGGVLERLAPPMHPNEIIALDDQHQYIPTDHIVRYVDADVNSKFDVDADGFIINDILPTTGRYFLRRVMRTVSGKLQIRPYCKPTPTRAELEIAAHGRDLLKSVFCGRRVLSLPFQLFIDGFGLYRNMYRSLMGVYLIPALSAAERTKRQNLFTITFGPHGTNFSDTTKALSPSFLQLDCEGVNVHIGGQLTRVVSSCLSFLGDMPQQNSNAGIKGPTAEYSCRSCTIKDINRSDLRFDIVKHGRYHYKLRHLRTDINNAGNKSRMEKLCQKNGISLRECPLFDICPSLNLVTFFPSDPCHSEYSGISKMAHSVLVSSLLSTNGQEQYLRSLQTFPFPRGWGRIQSPITHLESYQLQEHARASVLIPIILRCAMKDDWLQTPVFRMLPIAFGMHDSSAKDLIIGVFASIARSNSILLSQSPRVRNLDEVRNIVIGARQSLQCLLECAARITKPALGSRAASVTNSVTGSIADTLPLQDRADSDLIKEYGVANNCNVLIGEDKHREYKQLVRNTNHRDVEKTLLVQESFRRTVQLVFQGSFDDSESRLTQKIRSISNFAPTVLTSLHCVNDHPADDIDMDLAEVGEPLDSPKHSSINVTHRLPAKNRIDKLSIATANVSKLGSVDPFLMKFRSAYEADWNKPFILEPGPRHLQFYKKATFSFRGDNRRTTVIEGDILEYRESKLGRITTIFTHALDGYNTRSYRSRLFFSVTPVESIAHDKLLDLPLLRNGTADYDVIGLPALNNSSLYVIPVRVGDVASDTLVYDPNETNFLLFCTVLGMFLSFSPRKRSMYMCA